MSRAMKLVQPRIRKVAAGSAPRRRGAGLTPCPSRAMPKSARRGQVNRLVEPLDSSSTACIEQVRDPGDTPPRVAAATGGHRAPPGTASWRFPRCAGRPASWPRASSPRRRRSRTAPPRPSGAASTEQGRRSGSAGPLLARSSTHRWSGTYGGATATGSAMTVPSTPLRTAARGPRARTGLWRWTAAARARPVRPASGGRIAPRPSPDLVRRAAAGVRRGGAGGARWAGGRSPRPLRGRGRRSRSARCLPRRPGPYRARAGPCGAELGRSGVARVLGEDVSRPPGECRGERFGGAARRVKDRGAVADPGEADHVRGDLAPGGMPPSRCRAGHREPRRHRPRARSAMPGNLAWLMGARSMTWAPPAVLDDLLDRYARRPAFPSPRRGSPRA